MFYPEVADDTDFAVAPTRAGAQVMWQLRSPDAPEELGVALDLPAGASVRLTSPVTDPAGGEGGDAEIVDADGRAIGSISAPVAIDADGVGVPARFAFEDGRLVVKVPHRLADVRYPVMVDPEVRDVWGAPEFAANCGGGAGNHQPGVWSYGHWVTPFTPICGQEWNGSGHGLYIRSEGGLYLNGAVAQWGWSAPQGSYIMSVWFDGLRHGVAGSHLFTGLYGSDAWGSIVNHHQEIVWGQITQYPDSPYRSWAAFVGLFMDGSYNRTNWGWAGVRGVNIRLGDLGAPEVRLTNLSGGLTQPAGGGLPLSRWVDDAQTPVTVTATASDWGLGLQDVGVERAGGGWYGGPHHGCQGHRYSPCPRNWSPTFNLNQLPEGHNQIHTWSRDITDQIGIGAPWIQRIDRTPPNIQLTGELIDHATDGQLSANPELYIHATDGDSASLSARRSGVRRVKVFLDGMLKQDNLSPSSECDSCPRGQTWAPSRGTLASPSSVKVVAEDYLGHQTVREFTVNGFRTSWQYGGQNALVDSYEEVRSLTAAMAGGSNVARQALWASLDPASRSYYIESLLSDARSNRAAFGLVSGEAAVRSIFADPVTHGSIELYGAPMTTSDLAMIDSDAPPGPVYDGIPDPDALASGSAGSGEGEGVGVDEPPYPGEFEAPYEPDSAAAAGCDPATESDCSNVETSTDNGGATVRLPTDDHEAAAASRASSLATAAGASRSWFDRYGARADANAHGENPRTGLFSPIGGSDCTNFVSQVWHKGGGLNMTGKWFIRQISWERRFTASWAAVRNFVDYMVSVRQIASLITVSPGAARLPSSVGLGDAVEYDWGEGAGWSHLAVVVNLSGAYARISQHSSNRSDESWRRGWVHTRSPQVRANMRTRVVHVRVR